MLTNHRLEEKSTFVNVVILDCCREFMYRNTRSMQERNTRCLQKSERALNTIIAYACAPNDTASDGEKEHGKA